MPAAIIFSIEEFAVFDGPGIRLNVFVSGCPLRCQWCHNPEGWENRRQIVRAANGCALCGTCVAVCPNGANTLSGTEIVHSADKCTLCAQCVYNCPKHILRVSGEVYDTEKLTKRIARCASVLKVSGGGVTFSGGEVLTQADFLREMLARVGELGLHRAIETSGYGNAEDFARVLPLCDLVYYDLKVMDSDRHKFYTGVPNERILANARTLQESGVPHIWRVPFIHGVNTDRENLLALREFVCAELEPKVEFLLYNKMAGAKYKMVNKSYGYHFEQPTEEDLALTREIFAGIDISVHK